jgi:hypothetical protein
MEHTQTQDDATRDMEPAQLANLDANSKDPSYFDRWRAEQLPQILRFVNDEQNRPSHEHVDALCGLLQSLPDDFPQDIREFLTEARDVLSVLVHFWFGFPVRCVAAGVPHGANVYQSPSLGDDLIMVTDAGGRVLDRFDAPSNWILRGGGVAFEPLRPRPKMRERGNSALEPSVSQQSPEDGGASALHRRDRVHRGANAPAPGTDEPTQRGTRRGRGRPRGPRGPRGRGRGRKAPADPISLPGEHSGAS